MTVYTTLYRAHSELEPHLPEAVLDHLWELALNYQRANDKLRALAAAISRDMALLAQAAVDHRTTINELGELQGRGPALDATCARRQEAWAALQSAYRLAGEFQKLDPAEQEAATAALTAFKRAVTA